MWHTVTKLNKKTLNSISKGEEAQLRIELACAQKNIIVLKPTIQLRFDLVLYVNGKFYRAQVKYLNRVASNSKDCLELQLGNTSQKKKCYTSKDVDILLVFVPRVDAILCLEKEHFHNKKTIRIDLKSPKSKAYYKKYLW